MDDALFAQLQARGVVDSHGINDHPRRRHCGICGLSVWAAWGNGTGPIVAVDDIALTPRGEYEALSSGRETWEHWADGLNVRYGDLIRRFPASADPLHVIRPRHVCVGALDLDHYPVSPAPDDFVEPPF